MKRIVFFVFVLGLNYVLCSQNVGISSTPFTPDVSAGLDIQFSDKGLLIPRVALTNINDASTIALPAISLLVYCDGTAGLPAGYYYNTGTPATPNWTLLLSNNNVNNEVWMLEGNSGTNIATNFIGTTDNKPLYFRVNNVKAGYIGISSDNSVFLGYEAGLNDNGTNNQNAFIGSGAGRANTSGDFNTAGGYHALYCNTTGSGNTALGHRALRFNIDGFENTAVGYCTLDSNSTGVGNTVTGCYAAMSNKSGSWNSVSGYAALHDNTSGSQNSAFGFHALFSNTSGSQNTAIGLGTLSSNRAGNLATAVGHYAMFYSNSDSVPFQNHNVAVGAYSLRGSIIPADNTGNYNTIMGYEAAFHNASGDANTANGYMSLYYNSSGYCNTTLGALTLYNNSIGCSNLAAGYCSLNSNTSGSYNTAVGYYSSLIGNFTNTTTLGYWASTTADNQVRIGNSSVTSIGGQVAWTALSDARIKENIRQNVPGLDFVMQLKPVTYNLNKDKADSIIGISDSAQYKEKYEINTVLQTGFIAQDVENAAQSLGYDFCGIDKSGVENGGLYGLRYSVFVVPLVKATQEQQLIIEQQQEIIENLLIRIESLEKRINALDNQ